ncbi:MAG: leucine--tRNA ligase [Spirochaetaceae bacterium]
MSSYNFSEIEKKWQGYWEDNNCHTVDLDDDKKKFYMLEMFSYPSGDKLHCGHWYNYGPSDTYARYKKMMGYNVFQPMGFDAFGLPAENHAIKKGIHPEDSTNANIKYMIKQLKGIGAMYDWSKYIDTSKPDYYKWTQWIFLKLYEKGLAYRKKAPVNWCPSCNTVLANEQVKDGGCERCETLVIKKNLTQWFFKITDYAQDLLDGHNDVNWPEKTIAMQKNWVGKSVGAEIVFKMPNHDIPVFTTRPDTIFGVTYMTLAPEHPLVGEITTPEQKEAVESYITETSLKSEVDRLSTTKDKSGVFTGAYATNPINGKQIPIWIGDYVLYSYGTGAVMAVPAHDDRDLEFANNFGLEVIQVIKKKNDKAADEITTAYTDPGVMINSGEYDGMKSVDLKKKVTEVLEELNSGNAEINFRLRDWLISRQRYWGAPIPIVYCDKCGEQPVPESELPIKLPYDVEIKPKGDAPLATNAEFMSASCPKCGGEAKREADTMDTFVCSSWYYFRYPSANINDAAFDKDITKSWLPVDRYVGGPEHACMHLLYARFIGKVLMEDKKFEPFTNLTHQGIILAKDGTRMSKSKGNTISPDPYIEEYGADVFRAYLMFNFSYTEGGAWSDSQIKSVDKFVNRVHKLVDENSWSINSNEGEAKPTSKEEKDLYYQMHYAIKHVNTDIDKMQFNTSIARIMEFVNEFYKYKKLPKENQSGAIVKVATETLILLMAPFTPHLAEEMWESIGKKQSIFTQSYPKAIESYLAKSEITVVVQIHGKVRAQLDVSADITKDEIEKLALADDNVKKYIDGKDIKKFIYVPKKLVSIVV